MQKKVIGLVGIGQSPRTDIRATFEQYFGSDIEFIEKGILDGKTPSELLELAGTDPNYRLVSRLADGSQCILDKHKITPLVNKALADLKKEGVSAAVLLCTSIFPDLERPEGLFVIEAGKIIDHWIMSLCNENYKLGIIVPVDEQHQYMIDHYADVPMKSLSIATASPYGDEANVVRAAKELADTDVVIAHCMGYRLQHKKIMQENVKGGALISTGIVAQVLKELFRQI